MLRNKYRLRFDLSPLRTDIATLFDEDSNLAKRIFRIERHEIINPIINTNVLNTISFNNIVFLCNYLKIKDDKIYELTPDILKDDFRVYFGDYNNDYVQTK
jgi:hypothetical protein